MDVVYNRFPKRYMLSAYKSEGERRKRTMLLGLYHGNMQNLPREVFDQIVRFLPAHFWGEFTIPFVKEIQCNYFYQTSESSDETSSEDFDEYLTESESESESEQDD